MTIFANRGTKNDKLTDETMILTAHEDVRVQEDDSIQGLTLSGGGDLPLGGKMAQEGVDFGLPHVAGVLFRAEVFDVTNDPIAVSLFGAVRVMMITKYLPDLVHKL